MVSRCEKRRTVIAVFVAALLYPAACASQTVADASFCRSIKNEKECVDAYADGQTVSLQELTKDANGPVVYYSAALRNPSEYRVAIIMIRQGSCYSEKAALPEEKFRRSPGFWTGLRKFVGTLRVPDGLYALGLKELKGEVAPPKGSPVDIKVTAAFITGSDYYRVHSFRNVLCPGAIHARAFDSGGNPISGENEAKTIYITK